MTPPELINIPDAPVAASIEEEEGGELYEHFRVVADAGQQLLRIDKFLIDHLRDTSRNRIQQAARAGFIHVNGLPVKSNYRVKPRDIVTLLLDRPRFDTTIEPEDIPLEVVYEDRDLMVINKPAGMVVHPGCGNYHGTLVNAVAWHLRDCPAYDPNDPAVGLVHRIDKDTSGLLVVAKTPEAKTSLGVQFFNKTTRRTYNALVWSNFQEDEGRIEGNIGRDVHDRLRMAVSDDPGAREAITTFKTLERFEAGRRDEGYSLLECHLYTGRTHQIRVHMRHIGHPVVGDPLYGKGSLLQNKGLTRQFLHSWHIRFDHPCTGETIELADRLPDDLLNVLESLQGTSMGQTERGREVCPELGLSL